MGSVARFLAHLSFGARPTIVLVRVGRYKCLTRSAL